MAFGKVDHVINHISGERKAITNIDMDKEYGLKGYGEVDIDKEQVHMNLENYREGCIKIINNIDPSWGSRDYSQYIITNNNMLMWNKDAITSMTTTMLATMSAHLERIVEQGINPLNNF